MSLNNVAVEAIWKLAGLSPFLSKLVAGIGFVRSGTYLSKIGWYRSFQKRIPIDAAGEPIPWYSYPAISFLEERVQSNWHVLEYGCGNSTRWWSSRASRVDSCEHHRGWYESISNKLPANAECHFREDDAYISFSNEFPSKIDVLVIDGIKRVECAERCICALKEDGIIIWDDSNRSEFKGGFEYLIEQGFKRLDFAGLGPITMVPVATAVFYRPQNCLGL
ncbi:MAG: hypothetical protein V3V05_09985 [Pontiella sp.]